MAIDWRQRVREIEPKARVTVSATDFEIAAAERAVGFPFPADLKSLFRQTNGVMDDGYGPLLPLENARVVRFVDSNGASVELTHDYSITQYTLLVRSEEFARLNDWDEETSALLSTYVVLGCDIGGNMFGFFAGAEDTESVSIRYVEHDTVEVEDIAYTLEEYMRFYFKNCRWFKDKH